MARFAVAGAHDSVAEMFITGMGTATPARRYLQTQCWDALEGAAPFQHLNPRSRSIVKKILLGDNGIVSRHLALDPLAEAFELNPDALHARFARHAPDLATNAAREALGRATLKPHDIDALLISTCTGYLCPGLTSYVSERLQLRPSALLLDLVGQGCGAALPNLKTAYALLHSGDASRVLSVCVEVCSAALYLDDDPGVLVSACIFGDAAGAVVLDQRAPRQGRRIRWKGMHTHLDPRQRDALRFEHRGGMLRNILSPQVPRLAAASARTVFDRGMSAAGAHPEQITAWLWHAGGKEVLAALREEFGLHEGDVRWSAGVLRELGNVSSSCVLHVLKAAFDGGAPPGLWWMSSFGAGFSCHGALLEAS